MKRSHLTKCIPFVLFASACAYKPSAELTRAQEAYRQAASGSTSEVAPAELHMAKVALDNAASADRSDSGSEEAKDLAYVAERKAEWAQAQATTKVAIRNKTDAEKRLVNDQGAMLASQQQQLKQGKDALSQKDQALSQKDQALMQKDQALTQKERDLMDAKNSTAEAQALAAASAQREKEAADRERDAMAKLKASEDARGRVITMSSSAMFKTNQSILLAGARPKLDEVIAALKSMPAKTLLIEGHTDSVGNEQKNLELSDRRAAAVKAYIVSKGIADDRVKTLGAGQTHPIADNATVEGRAMNRRVEMVFQTPSATDSTATAK